MKSAGFDKDIWGHPWSPPALCPRRIANGGDGTEGICAARRHLILCRHCQADPTGWYPRIRDMGDETRPPRATPSGPPPPPCWPRPDGRLRVGFAGPIYASHGGTEVWHQTLLPALARSAQIQVLGYAVGTGGGDPDRLGGPLGLGLESIRSLARACDVLVIWGFTDRDFDLLPTAGRPRTVLVIHATTKMPWARQLLETGGPRADRLVGVASVALADLPESLADKPRKIIPNAIDPARVRPSRSRHEVRAEWGVTPETIVLFGHHRFAEEKRLPLLAAAVGRLGVPYRLVLAGDGSERAKVEGRPGVTLLGRREDIGDLFAGADLFVAASEHEGFGLSTAEALASGVPVISTPVGFLVDHPELARTVPIDAGPTEWAAAIRAEWQDEAGRAARAEEAQAFVRQHFSPDGFVRAWEDYLLSLPRPVPLSQNAKPAPGNVPAPPPPRRSPREIRQAIQAGQGIAAKVRDCPHASPAPATWGQTCGCTRTCRERGQGVTYSACVTCLTSVAVADSL